MRVYVAAFGSGMGHASRMAALARRLTASGDEVMFSSSGEVSKWLASSGFLCNDLPLVDVVFNEVGAFSATATLNFFPRILAHLCQQVQREVANISRFAPDVVLSDSVASTLVASRLLRVPSVVVLNQLRLVSSPRTPRPVAGLLTAASVRVGGFFWGLCDEVLVPDLPPPLTISEANLWSAGGASSRAKYIGFLTPGKPRVTATDDPLMAWKSERARKKVFWQISGPPATRGPFLAKALRCAAALADEYSFVITAGAPTGGRAAKSVPGGWLYEWCDISSAYLDACDVVVSRAGHVSISDYILSGKPSLLVPIRAQTEQMGNANKARRLGVSLSAEEGSLEPPAVRAALRELTSARFARPGVELRSVAERYDAFGSVTGALRSASGRR